jgi:hypothetical protein
LDNAASGVACPLTFAPRIEITAEEDPANGFTSPVHTELAVSTAA